MHALLVDLLPWLAAFLALDGLTELRRGHLLVISAGGPGRALQGGLRLLAPWPVVEAVAGMDLPWLGDAAALHLVAPGRRAELAVVEPSDLEAIAWEGLAPRAEGRKVLAGGRLLALAPHPEVAARLAADLASVAAAADREAALSARLAAASDLAAARALRARQRPWLLPLRLLATLLWLGLFGLGGAVALGVAPAWLGAGGLLAALLPLLVAEAALGAGMLRACGRTWRRAATGGLGLLAWPVAALRPLTHLSRGLYAAWDGLAVAAALLPPERFGALAARELGRLDASRRAGGPALEGAWARRERTLSALLASAGASAAALRAPPPPGPGEAAWCPVCRTGYREGFERCADCAAPLRPFRGAGEGG